MAVNSTATSPFICISWQCKWIFFTHRLTVLEKKIYINLFPHNYQLFSLEEIVEMADNIGLWLCRYMICSYPLANLAVSAILDKIWQCVKDRDRWNSEFRSKIWALNHDNYILSLKNYGFFYMYILANLVGCIAKAHRRFFYFWVH